MKTNSLQLPITVTHKLALAIVDQLPKEEYEKFVSGFRRRSRDRALTSLRRFRSNVSKSGLTQPDFIKALEEVRGPKAKKATSRRY
jgi:hypothetical protein